LSAKLEVYSFISFFCALILIWSCESQWWGWAWVGIYFVGEILIASAAEKRVLATRLREVKIWFPEMTPVEQAERAMVWLKSGLTPLEYESQQRISKQRDVA